MRIIAISLPIWTFFAVAFTLLPSVTAAQTHEVTYDRIVFERSNEADDLAWSQLLFRVEGFRIDGLCYNSCSISFSLDGTPMGPYSNRADLRITRALVTSSFPTDHHGQMFIGNRQHRLAEVEALEAFGHREKLALAWIVQHSDELIDFALASSRVAEEVRPYWQRQQTVFESRLSSVFTNVLSGYRDDIATRNMPNDLTNTIQPALVAMELYAGPVDGIAGRGTREGIRQFQRERNRLVTGYADSQERDLLAEFMSRHGDAVRQTGSSHTELLARRLGIELSEANDSSIADASESESEAAAELRRQLDAANETIADLCAGSVTVGEHEELRRQLDAANATLADLRNDSVPRSELLALEARLTEMVPAAELQDAERRLSAANETIADLRATSVPEADHFQLQRRLDAANATIADLREGSVPRADYRQLEARLATMVSAEDLRDAERRLDAANETIADMRDTMVPVAQTAEIARQLEAANATVANLRQTRVPMEDHLAVRRQLDAANQTVADLRSDIEQNYVDRSEAEMREDTLSRQISALNQTILELTEERDRQRGLRQQTEQIYQNWIDDCRSQTACAIAMQLN